MELDDKITAIITMGVIAIIFSIKNPEQSPDIVKMIILAISALATGREIQKRKGGLKNE